MASKVNTKFIITLAAVLGVVCASVAGTAFFVLWRSADRLRAAGDQLVAAGNYAQAIQVYGKAFRKDTSRADILALYIDAIRKWEPPTEVDYEDAYRNKLNPALVQYAALRPADVEAQRQNLDELYRASMKSPGVVQVWQELNLRADTALATFEAGTLGDDSWQSLRRYRGLALLNRTMMGDQVESEVLAKMIPDLEAALAADPNDTASAMGLIQFHFTRSEDGQRSGNTAIADTEAKLALGRARDFLSKNPSNAAVRLLGLFIEARVEARSLGVGAEPSVRNAMVAEAAKKHEGALRTAIDFARDWTATDVEQLGLALQLERFIRNSTEWSMSLGADLLERENISNEAIVFYAERLRDERRFEESIAALDRIIARKRPPVSLEGMSLILYQGIARDTKVENAIAAFEVAPEGEKAEMLARAKRYREDLGGVLGAEKPQLKYLDAMLALAENRRADARRLITEYNSQSTRRDPRGLMLAIGLERTINPGRARDMARELATLQPDSVNAAAILADLEFSQSNWAAADALYERILATVPDDETAKSRRSAIKALRGESTGDPVQDAVIKARNTFYGMTGPRDPARAITELRQAIAGGLNSVLLHQLMVGFLAESGDEAAARAAAEAGLAAFPGDEGLQSQLATLSIEDPVERSLNQIDTWNASEAQKIAARYRIYAQAQRTEDADRTLNELKAADPEFKEGTTIELFFLLALENKNWSEAERFAGLAGERDLDLVRGQMYRAQIAYARENMAEVMSLLRGPSDQPNATWQVCRLYGLASARSGNLEQAVEALRKAYNQNPGAPSVIDPYLQALVGQGRLIDALEVCRKSTSLSASMPGFMERYLSLEAQVGDRALALRERRKLDAEDPTNVANAINLVDLYLGENMMPEARARLDLLRAAGADSPRVDILDAQWHVRNGTAPKAQEILSAAVTRTLATDPPPATDTLIEFGVYLAQAGLPEQCVKVFEMARKGATGNQTGVDRVIARNLFAANQFEAALPIIESLLAAGATPEPMDLSMYIETLLFLRRVDDANKVLEQHASLVEDSMQLMLLSAEAARQSGDSQRASDILERTVQKHPGEAIVYFKRAELESQRSGGTQRAIDDLTQAIRLDRANTVAYQMRAQFYMEIGELDRAVDDIRQAVTLNPNLTTSRDVLITLLSRMNRVGEAQVIARRAVEGRERDGAMHLYIAGLFASAGAHEAAIPYFEKGVELLPSAPAFDNYVRSLLLQRRPDFVRASDVLSRRAATLVSSSPMLMMDRAMLRAMQSPGSEEPLRDAASAIAMCNGDPAAVGAVFVRLPDAIPDPARRADFVQRRADLSKLPDMYRDYFVAQVLALAPETRTQAIETIRRVMTSSQIDGLRVNAAAMCSSWLSEAKDYEGALAALLDGLKISPDDPALNNNAGYMLAAHMGRAADGLPYARKSVEALPDNANVLHTLGYVLMRTQQYEEAERVLIQSMRTSQTPNEQINALLELTELELMRQNLSTASDMVNRTKRLVDRFAPDSQRYKDELERLRSRLR